MKIRISHIRLTYALAACLLISAGATSAAPRDVQIVSIDFESEVIELHNFASVGHDLSGWRFCTHDADQVRLYSPSGGLDSVAIGAGESLFIHFNGDAPDEPGHIDRPGGRGTWAEPLGRGPYAMGLYFPPVSFGDGQTIADYLQWSIDGSDSSIADERADEAEAGGVWSDQNEWVATAADSASISLLVTSEGLVLHGSEDYAVLPEPGRALLQLAALLGIAAAAPTRRIRSTSAGSSQTSLDLTRLRR